MKNGPQGPVLVFVFACAIAATVGVVGPSAATVRFAEGDTVGGPTGPEGGEEAPPAPQKKPKDSARAPENSTDAPPPTANSGKPGAGNEQKPPSPAAGEKQVEKPADKAGPKTPDTGADKAPDASKPAPGGASPTSPPRAPPEKGDGATSPKDATAPDVRATTKPKEGGASTPQVSDGTTKTPPVAPTASPLAAPVVAVPAPAVAAPAPVVAAPAPAVAAPAPIATDGVPALAAPAPAPVLDERLLELLAAISAAETRIPADPRELESLCLAWVPKKFTDQDPSLPARLQMCAAKGAFAAGRIEVARDRLDEAERLLLQVSGALVDAPHRRADLWFRRAEIESHVVFSENQCGEQLGLRDLLRFEAAQQTERFERVIAMYREALKHGDPRLGAVALSRIADLAARHYRASVHRRPTSYRAHVLPSPFGVERVDVSGVVDAELGMRTAWPREVDRLYGAALRAATRVNDDQMRADVEASRARFHQDLGPDDGTAGTRLERVEAPFTIPAGAIFYDGQEFHRKTPSSSERITNGVAMVELEQRAAGGLTDPLTVFALMALAEWGKKPPVETTLALLASESWLGKLAGLRMVEIEPLEAHFEPVIALFDRERTRDSDAYLKRFGTLTRALFGVEERAILALRSIVTRERALASKVTYDNRVPLDERAFLVAELGDQRLQARVQEMVMLGDERASALALYATYKTQGRRALWFVRQHTRGLLGCVSGLIVELDRLRDLGVSSEPGMLSGVP